jgi:hypothetical protein
MLPIIIFMITLPLWIVPCYLRGPVKCIAFNVSSRATAAALTLRSGSRKGVVTKHHSAGAPSTVLFLIGLVKGTSSEPYYCKGLGFTRHVHSSSVTSLNLKILSSTLSQGILGISNSFPLANHSNNLLTSFLTEREQIPILSYRIPFFTS